MLDSLSAAPSELCPNLVEGIIQVDSMRKPQVPVLFPNEGAHVKEIWDGRNRDEIRSDSINFPAHRACHLVEDFLLSSCLECLHARIKNGTL
jgi:hypothetical protein